MKVELLNCHVEAQRTAGCAVRYGGGVAPAVLREAESGRCCSPRCDRREGRLSFVFGAREGDLLPQIAFGEQHTLRFGVQFVQ